MNLKSIGNYDIVRLIGKGGMGEVYLAQDRLLDRKVALKVLKQDLVENKTFISRFSQEAKTLAKLNHPNIATLYNLIADQDQFVMVMEYVEGMSLEEIIQKKGQLPLASVNHITSGVLKGLKHAHDNGIIHRDIKPSNIMLNKAGEVKVMDFGIAISEGNTRHTRAGNIIGTIEYLAPELIKGEDPAATSDIYATGVVMYEMISGQVPFSGSNEYAIMDAHLNKKASPLRSDMASVPKKMEALVKKCLVKSKKQRFQSSDEMLEALQSESSIKPALSSSLVNSISDKVKQVKNISTGSFSTMPSKSYLLGGLLIVALSILGYAVYQRINTPVKPIKKQEPKVIINDNKTDYSSSNKPSPQAQIPVQKSINERVKELVETGNRLANQKKYMPPGENLYDICIELLEIDNNHPKAHEWLNAIANHYLKIAEAAIKNREFAKAQKNINVVFSMEKDNPHATRLQKMLDNAITQSRKKSTPKKQEPKKKASIETTTKKQPEKRVIAVKEEIRETDKKTVTPVKVVPVKKATSEPKKTTTKTKKTYASHTLSRNLEINLILRDNLSTMNSHRKGQSVQVEIAQDIYENGKLVFRSGDRATATLKDFKTSTDNNKGLLHIQIDAVKAVDGTNIKVKRGSFRIPGGKGEEVTLSSGTKFKVLNAASKKIKLEL